MINNQNNTNQNAKVALNKVKNLLETTNDLLSKKANDDLENKSKVKLNFADEDNTISTQATATSDKNAIFGSADNTIKVEDSKDTDIKIDFIHHNGELKIKVNGEDYILNQKTKMQIIKENLESFFITWGIILFLNQVVLFGGCFNPLCLIAALPHTGFIAFLIVIFFIYDEKKNKTPQTKKIEEKVLQALDALEEDYKRKLEELKA